MTEESWTTEELDISEAYISLLHRVSRCAQAVDEEDFYGLSDRTAQLRSAADRLCGVLGQSSGRPEVRPGVVRAFVARHGDNVPACRLLHPEVAR